MTAILALDQGTTSTRALLVGADARAEVIFARPHAQHYPQPGWVEHDPEELLASLCAALAAVPADAGVVAVGLANQGESCLAWDAATGRAISPVIVWQDDRTRGVTEALAAAGHGPSLRARTGLPLDPYFSASKLGWIMAEVPEAAALLAAGRLRLGTTDAFFLDRLAGVYRTDVTTAARTGLMDLATCQWDANACALFGVPLAALPPIGASTGALGRLASGGGPLPLTASLVDQQASLYGHGCRAPGQGKITFGTGAFALVLSGPGGPVLPASAGPLPTLAWQMEGQAPVRALEGGVYAAAAAVDWARNLGLFGDFAEIDSFAAEPAIARGLVFVPALAGLGCPHWDRRARGAWLGLGLDTGPRDMVQAVLEGVALRSAEVLAALSAALPPGAAPADAPLPVDGGLTGSAYFCQFLADVLGRAVQVSDQPEVTALGVAGLAAQGAGLAWPGVARGRMIAPRPMPGAWQARFAAARQAVQTFGTV